MPAPSESAALAAPASVLLTVMSGITLDRTALATARALGTTQDIAHDIEHRRVHVAMVKFAAHITTFSSQMILVADLLPLGPALVALPRTIGRSREVSVNAFPIFIDGDEFIGFAAHRG